MVIKVLSLEDAVLLKSGGFNVRYGRVRTTFSVHTTKAVHR